MDLFDPENLELTLKASNEGIWDWNVGEKEIFYSERVLHFLGIEGKEAPNMMLHPEELIYKDDVPYFSNVLTLALEDSAEEIFKLDCRFVKADGSFCWLRVRGIVVREEHKAVRMAGSMIDITKRKRAERQVSEERNRLRLVIDNVPLQVYFKNKEFQYVLVNQRQADWVGASSPKDLIGKTAKDYFSESSWSSSHAEELEIMETGKALIDIIQREEWPQKPSTYVKKMKYPWYSSEGELLGTYGISCDVTQLVSAQKKLETLALALSEVNNKFEEELILAREIQFAILPENSSDWEERLSQWEHRLNIEHLYIPATELAGDYYDIIHIDENRIGFLIIDVMGHGIRSALIVSLIRGLMEQALPFALDPATYMDELNRSLTSVLLKTSVTMFASACYVLVDYERGVVAMTSAGHEAPLLQFKKGIDNSYNTVAKLKKNPVLGIFPEAEYNTKEYDLKSLEKILLYTDGIYEIPGEDEHDWGRKRLVETFEKSRGESIEHTQKEIYKAALDWSDGQGFLDDVCLIGIQLKDIENSKLPNVK